MIYLIIGDIHGNWSDLGIHIKNVLMRGFDFDAIIQVGDFGIYPESSIKQLKQMFHRMKFDKPIYFVDGNHEDHTYLYNSVSKLSKMNIFYQPRSSITITEDNVKIGWLGGAFNVDRPQYISELSCNFPLQNEIENMVQNIKMNNGIDLMVTHSCPMHIGINIIGHPIFEKMGKLFINQVGYESANMYDIGDQPLTTLWEKLDDVHKPKTWVFGHMHVDHYAKIENTEFYCCGHCTGAGIQRMPQIYLYDTKTKEIIK